jgi:hypothetical protein
MNKIKRDDVRNEEKERKNENTVVHQIAGRYRVFQQGVASADGLNWAPNHTHGFMQRSFVWIVY